LAEKRELEGIGYHYFDFNDDCLLVDQWTKRPDDLNGQSLTIGKLLPREFRCADFKNNHYGGYREKPPPRKFRFRIIIEIDKKP